MAAPDHEIPDKGDLNFSPGVAYSARVNNVWQGGKDNFAADRVAAERAVEAFPHLPAAVQAGGVVQQLAAHVQRDRAPRAGVQGDLEGLAPLAVEPRIRPAGEPRDQRRVRR